MKWFIIIPALLVLLPNTVNFFKDFISYTERKSTKVKKVTQQPISMWGPFILIFFAVIGFCWTVSSGYRGDNEKNISNSLAKASKKTSDSLIGEITKLQDKELDSSSLIIGQEKQFSKDLKESLVTVNETKRRSIGILEDLIRDSIIRYQIDSINFNVVIEQIEKMKETLIYDFPDKDSTENLKKMAKISAQIYKLITNNKYNRFLNKYPLLLKGWHDLEIKFSDAEWIIIGYEKNEHNYRTKASKFLDACAESYGYFTEFERNRDRWK